MPAKSYWGNERVLIIILMMLCLSLFFFRLGTRPLWDIDEGMHAAISKAMVLSGDWVTPQYNGKNFYDKPPLFNWLAAFSFLVFGFTEFAARLPAALLGSGCVMTTYLLGRRMFNLQVAFLSAVVLATSAEYIILSRVVVHDISLVFCDTLALTLFFLGYQNARHRKRNFLLGYAALGLDVLAKGPVGVVMPAMIIVLFLVYKKQLGFLKEMQMGRGVLLFLAITAPWYILICLKNPDYFEYFFIKKNVGSFLSKTSRHQEPFYYYFPVLLGGFFPWSCFFPLSLIHAFRFHLKNKSQEMIFLLIWFGFIFLFFSTARSKLATYILPLYPAASILVGVIWYDLINSPTRQLRRGFTFSFLPLVITFPLALIYIWIYPPTQLLTDSGLDSARLYYVAFWMVICVIVSFSMLLMQKDKTLFATIVGMISSTALLFLLLMVPSINPYRSTKELAYKFDAMQPQHENLVFFDKALDSALFYSNRGVLVLNNPQQLKEYLISKKNVYCILKSDDLKLIEDLKPFFDIADQVGNKVLITNKKLGHETEVKTTARELLAACRRLSILTSGLC
jgi:4-amino-4-deoxy-L-arabinose transferase-like glycosyltransferase